MEELTLTPASRRLGLKRTNQQKGSLAYGLLASDASNETLRAALVSDRRVIESRAESCQKVPLEQTATMRSSSSSTSEASPTRRRLDEVIAGAMVVLVLVYSTVSFLTYYKLSTTADRYYLSGGGTEGEPALDTAAVSNAQKSVEVPDRVSQIYDLQHHSFPLHVGNDLEEIVHPGLALVKDSPQKTKGLPATLKVPKFFEDSHGHVYGGSIRAYLGGGNRLPTPLEAKSVGSFDSEGRESIYASVASYRDYECRLTVEDLYARAKYPNRIRVAIIDQIVDGDDKCNVPVDPCETNPNQSLCKYAHLIDYYQMDARLAVGPVFARHMAHRFYRGEYFGMQVRIWSVERSGADFRAFARPSEDPTVYSQNRMTPYRSSRCIGTRGQITSKSY